MRLLHCTKPVSLLSLIIISQVFSFAFIVTVITSITPSWSPPWQPCPLPPRHLLLQPNDQMTHIRNFHRLHRLHQVHTDHSVQPNCAILHQLPMVYTCSLHSLLTNYQSPFHISFHEYLVNNHFTFAILHLFQLHLHNTAGIHFPRI